MGLDIFFLEDIRNALLAANEASTSTARTCAAGGGYGQGAALPLHLQAYLEGYRAALVTVALAFGLSPDIVASRGETLEVQAMRVNDILPSG